MAVIVPGDYTVNVSYNINGGSGSGITGSTNTSLSSAERVSVSVTLKSKPSGWTKTGYTLKGWATSAGGGVAYSFGGTLTHEFVATYAEGRLVDQTFDVTLYAVWQRTTYTISYNANGGSGAPSSQTKYYNTNITLSSTKPTWSGHEFKGWATSASGSVAYQPGATYSANANVTLYAVWQDLVSSVAIRSGTVGGNAVIRVTSLVSGTTFKLTYKCGGKSGNIATNQQGASAGNYVDYTWEVPEDLAEEGPSATFVEVKVTCQTYISGTSVGKKSATKNMTIPDNSTFKPTAGLTFILVNDNTTINGWGVAVQGFTKIKLTGTGSAAYGASVASYAFSGPDFTKSYTSSAASKSPTTGAVIRSGSLTYKVVVTDTRGYKSEATVPVTVYPYAAPAITQFIVYRSDASGNADMITGTRLTSYVKYAFSDCNGNNHAHVSIKYKATTDGSYTSWINSATSEQLYTLGTDISIANAYEIRCEMTDDLGLTNLVQIVTVPSVIGVAIGIYNDRVRFGGPCQIPGFECDWDAVFHGDVALSNNQKIMKSLWTGTWDTGNITVTGISQYKMCIVRMSGQGTLMLVFIHDNGSTVFFRGEGGYAVDSSSETRYYISATISNDTLTMVDCHSVTSGGTITARTVREIIGVM